MSARRTCRFFVAMLFIYFRRVVFLTFLSRRVVVYHSSSSIRRLFIALLPQLVVVSFGPIPPVVFLTALNYL